jgi:hypothetical protein
MRSRYPVCLLILVLSPFALCLLSPAWGQGASQQSIPKNGGDSPGGLVAKVPSGVILVKGAWSSASDSGTPMPEGGDVAQGVFRDRYFGITYALPPDWMEKYKGPPPSDAGRYVLAELSPAATFKGPARGSILIGADDFFFTPEPARNAVELIDYMSHHLQSVYNVEAPPKQIKMADHSFAFFAYWSPAAQLHWYVLATEIRCHAVQIVLTSRDTKLLDSLMLDLNKMKLPAEADSMGGTGGGAVPVCIKDYARGDNMLARVDPIFTEHKFNPVPVRIVIGKDGNVKHIHFISAFPDQTKAISDALAQWKFKPYRKDGQAVEVETGIQFGRANAR